MTATYHGAAIPLLPSCCLCLRLPSFAEKAEAEDAHSCLQDGHLLPGSFQLDASAESKQRHYCAAGLVTQLKPGVVVIQ